VYVYDERHYRILDLGFRKTSHLRYKYLQDTLINLRENYRKIGGNILIGYGKPEEILPKLVADYQCHELIYQQEIMSEETEVESQLKEEINAQSCQLTPVWGRTLYHLDDLPYELSTIPITSKAFRINTSKATEPRALFSTPERIRFVALKDYGDVDQSAKIGFSDEELATDYDAEAFPAGETAALERLGHYTFDSELLTNYKWTRNKSLGLDYSNKFSPYLAHGSFAPTNLPHGERIRRRDKKEHIDLVAGLRGSLAGLFQFSRDAIRRYGFLFRGLQAGKDRMERGLRLVRPVEKRHDGYSVRGCPPAPTEPHGFHEQPGPSEHVELSGP